ncbi:uncharacterized protein A4U43_C08F16450 [Asparagus officinalis]|uniref:SNAP25 homologous protein SNAP33-like n=1 Tax=Asparagus officinalis TaxID=4686 RepID=UPI00098E30A9|nr:SNAP25 homologous protein SNAP33-like [Asparagus officinalis]XP_020241815.1 SNAP25 homologous protein SNAP33-like [Asparagus officinalis]ONK60279.1 uncharacterized protein A4U43_C08F16450 [Asparagus officinalis]
MPPKVDIKKRINNPFDSDSDTESKAKPGRGATSSSAAKNGYKNGLKGSGGLENQSVQELENYAAYKAEETTDAVNGCVRIAEAIREDASNTLVTLHAQGEQIYRTHEMCTKIDQDLSKGESLLGSLGGMFSKPWKAKKTRHIKGPMMSKDDSFKKKKKKDEQREKLGLSPPRSKSRQYDEPVSAMDKVKVEKQKQDDSLNDLSGILGQLKGMACEMGSELDKQNKALDGLNDDVEELNSRVKGANRRTRNLLGK